MRGLSRCAGSYCTKGYDVAGVRACQDKLPDDWNELCAYQGADEACRYCRERVPHSGAICASGKPADPLASEI